MRIIYCEDEPITRKHVVRVLRGAGHDVLDFEDGAAGLAVLAAAVPLALWAIHNAVRYDDLTVARGGKAWVPFFKVAGRVDPASGDASRRLAEAVEREVLTKPP